MEKVLKEMKQDAGVHADRILEINPDHPLFAALKKAHDDHKDLSDYAQLMYDQALLIAGLEIKDPAQYSKRLSRIMIEAMQ